MLTAQGLTGDDYAAFYGNTDDEYAERILDAENAAGEIADWDDEAGA
jgi:hypothetical protein